MMVAELDFETFSSAGYVWTGKKWGALEGAPSGKNRYGLGCVGATRYAEHPSTEVLSMYYDLHRGAGPEFWCPGEAPPLNLLNHVRGGGLVEAWNVAFERLIWEKVCVPQFGWPHVPSSQWRCAMSKARAFGLPGRLELAGSLLDAKEQKNPDGGRLLDKFSKPRNPTAKDPRTRVLPSDDPADAGKLYDYNRQDIVSEHCVSGMLPDLEGEELEFWQVDQEINHRGIHVDAESVDASIVILKQAFQRYNDELCALTEGRVEAASQLPKLKVWLAEQGVEVGSLDEEAMDALLATPGLPERAQRALEIRKEVGSASVKKVYSMRNQLAEDGRLHDLYVYHGARTGRPTGQGPQPTNLPKYGPPVLLCTCGHHHQPGLPNCPWCGMPVAPGKKPTQWNPGAVEDALLLIRGRNLALLEAVFGHALSAISGCLRGMLMAKPGYELVSSDFHSIEAVVIAMTSGEKWREEVFRGHGKIYEMSASKITGIAFEEYLDYKKRTGQHHPTRNTLGKVAELALGFGGAVGGWRGFYGPGTDEEIVGWVQAWRKASPAIVQLWNDLENAAVNCLLRKGTEFPVGKTGMVWRYEMGAARLRIMSGRWLTYHEPEIHRDPQRGNKWAFSYAGWNTNPNNGPTGWLRMRMWGGKFTENQTQADARDIQRYSMINLGKAGYPIVLHTYDEIASEVPQGEKSLGEFERIMATMPGWAANWPIRADGGWRAERYRKGD